MSQNKLNSLGYKKNYEICFNRIFHSNTFWEGLPIDHLLNQATYERDSVLDNVIRGLSEIETGCNFPLLNYANLKQQSKLLELFKHFLQKWKKLSLKVLLEKYCQPFTEQNIILEEDIRNLSSANKCMYNKKILVEVLSDSPVVRSYYKDNYERNLIHSHLQEPLNFKTCEQNCFKYALHWKSVYQFLLVIINRSIPLELFGSKYNKNCFLKAIKTFLLLGKYDTFYLEHLMLNVKISHCRWADSLNSFLWKSKAVATVWLWLFRNCIMQILQSYFYITESSNMKYQIFWFRKKHWQSLHDHSYKQLLKNGTLRVLTSRQISLFADVSFSCGSPLITKPAALRFIPKLNGLRPILPVRSGGLSKKEILKANILINYLTSNAFNGLYSVRSLVSFYKIWLQNSKFIIDFSHQFYAVKVDVKDAYGSIKQDLLTQLLSKESKNLDKIIKFGRFESIECYKKKSAVKIKYIRIDDFGHRVESKYNDKVLVSAGYPLSINVQETISNIIKLISGQIIRVGKHTRLLVTGGIAQGATLSSSLCEFYYSAMIYKHLLYFQRDSSILLRSVDDFLYITSSKEKAQQFLERMENGIENFNCHINKSKTVHNLNKHLRILFRGIILCTASRQLLVSTDLLAKYSPRYSIRINKYDHPGKFVILRLQQITRARLPKLLVDPAYASEKSIVSNVWRCAIMVGSRLSPLINVMLLPRKQFNPNFIIKSLIEISSDVWIKVKGLWRRSGHILPFSKKFFILVYLGGVLATLGRPHHPPLFSLRKLIKITMKKKSKFMNASQKVLLPKKIRTFVN